LPIGAHWLRTPVYDQIRWERGETNHFGQVGSDQHPAHGRQVSLSTDHERGTSGGASLLLGAGDWWRSDENHFDAGGKSMFRIAGRKVACDDSFVQQPAAGVVRPGEQTGSIRGKD